MPSLTIDGQTIPLQHGQTILEGARALGINIPTLCHAGDLPHMNSCMVCLVRNVRTSQFLPACSYPVDEDMAVDASSAAVLQARRDAVELLLREHFGDCEAPCRRGCPADLDIPAMMRAIQTKDWPRAGAIVREHICLPQILGAICPAPCEKLCRRNEWDTHLAICRIKGFVGADGRGIPAAPTACTAHSVAIIGGGPAGVSAAWHLRLMGHACTVYDKAGAPYEPLINKTGADRLPLKSARADYETVAGLGVHFKNDSPITKMSQLHSLKKQYDAILLAGGEEMVNELPDWGVHLSISERFTTETPGIFTAGGVRSRMRLAAKAVGDGAAAARTIHHFLDPSSLATSLKQFDSRAGTLGNRVIADMAKHSPVPDRASSTPDTLNAAEAVIREAGRCMSCDCTTKDACRLRDYADLYGIPSVRHHPPEDVIDQPAAREHPELIFAAGKCIRCGLCVRLAEHRSEPIGLAFNGRGRRTHLAVPFGKSLAQAITRDAGDYAQICPTGALFRVDSMLDVGSWALDVRIRTAFGREPKNARDARNSRPRFTR